jgi:hypothetical protein
MDEAQTKKDERQMPQTTTDEVAKVESLPYQDPVYPRADSTVSLLDEARKVTEEMRKANVETRELLDRRERIAAEEMIHGRALAGMIPTKKEESPEEYAQRVLAGKANPLKP